VALYAGRGLWLSPIGTFLVTEDPLTPAEAVVPLAGDRERLLYAAQLLREGYAAYLLLTDMRIPQSHPKAPSFAALSERGALAYGVPHHAIRRVPGRAATTYAEAQNIRRFAEAQGWRSLLVVTSPFHTRRTGVLFEDVFRGSGVTLRVRAVRPSRYRADAWWRSREGWRNTSSEYLKLLLYHLGYHHLFPDKG